MKLVPFLLDISEGTIPYGDRNTSPHFIMFFIIKKGQKMLKNIEKDIEAHNYKIIKFWFFLLFFKLFYWIELIN